MDLLLGFCFFLFQKAENCSGGVFWFDGREISPLTHSDRPWVTLPLVGGRGGQSRSSHPEKDSDPAPEIPLLHPREPPSPEPARGPHVCDTGSAVPSHESLAGAAVPPNSQESQGTSVLSLLISYRFQREGERKVREKDMHLLFHLFTHSLVDPCMWSDRGWNPQPWRLATTR